MATLVTRPRHGLRRNVFPPTHRDRFFDNAGRTRRPRVHTACEANDFLRQGNAVPGKGLPNGSSYYGLLTRQCRIA